MHRQGPNGQQAVLGIRLARTQAAGLQITDQVPEGA